MHSRVGILVHVAPVDATPSNTIQYNTILYLTTLHLGAKSAR